MIFWGGKWAGGGSDWGGNLGVLEAGRGVGTGGGHVTGGGGGGIIFNFEKGFI